MCEKSALGSEASAAAAAASEPAVRPAGVVPADEGLAGEEIEQIDAFQKSYGARVKTRDAIALQESMSGSTVAPVVYYIPRKDVKMERLARSSHQTHCPFKGQASYYSLANGPENAVWTYEQPYDEMTAIKELLAFYPDKVDSITAT